MNPEMIAELERRAGDPMLVPRMVRRFIKDGLRRLAIEQGKESE
jgi:hypothetical protein